MPVGFKWFVDGLIGGSLGFAGEESAGASFLRRDGSVWTTDKDGIILGLLAAEITAKTKRDSSEAYDRLTRELGVPFYERIDASATPGQKNLLKTLSPNQIGIMALAGEPIRAKLTVAPGNGLSFGGIKVIAENGWFAVPPSGTEDIYKIYAESFRSEGHLRQIQQEAQNAIASVFETASIATKGSWHQFRNPAFGFHRRNPYSRRLGAVRLAQKESLISMPNR
jgi:phosphoglucomutase